MPNDWVDLKEKIESKSKPILKEKQKPSSRQADVVQHEVAALKMAQGLLKGMYLLNVVDLTACYRQNQHSINRESATWAQHGSHACNAACAAYCVTAAYKAVLCMLLTDGMHTPSRLHQAEVAFTTYAACR